MASHHHPLGVVNVFLIPFWKCLHTIKEEKEHIVEVCRRSHEVVHDFDIFFFLLKDLLKSDGRMYFCKSKGSLIEKLKLQS